MADGFKIGLRGRGSSWLGGATEEKKSVVRRVRAREFGKDASGSSERRAVQLQSGDDSSGELVLHFFFS